MVSKLDMFEISETMVNDKSQVPTKKQVDLIARALNEGYIYLEKGVSGSDVKKCCKMGWLSLQEGGRFYPTVQGTNAANIAV